MDEAYFFALGFLLADGWVERKNYVRCDLVIQDHYFFSNFQKLFGGKVSFSKKVDKRNGKTYWRSRYHVSNKTLAQDLITLKTGSMVLPHPYTPAFLAGLINGDGSLYPAGNYFRFELCLDNRYYNTIANWFTNTLDIKPKYKNTSIAYLIVNKQNEVNKIYQYLIKPFPKIRRKWAKYQFALDKK